MLDSSLGPSPTLDPCFSEWRTLSMGSPSPLPSALVMSLEMKPLHDHRILIGSIDAGITQKGRTLISPAPSTSPTGSRCTHVCWPHFASHHHPAISRKGRWPATTTFGSAVLYAIAIGPPTGTPPHA
ncbi:hypothetical protein COCNU_scaffold013033G000010 [Cocos nucifera]|nr:hypothetical protein [Cocos nucifera]